ncbi:glycerophosphodiester phosphodiesterase family protein [Caulobacter sp. RHG1]|uniref:glycerophosphodiester phosphodiesterase family protein n=1 Tax=Caulobacter sp. (strain RHG1) TaxID=2545762 RepID=UPI001555C5F3|nr:glycerophosphodiester phosphodiesterase family protein [Caulobacter sp. RHG1]NQE61055.1 Glycerophosphoryl diester phosphodiesterase [Caulobacter sp. RHG1]
MRLRTFLTALAITAGLGAPAAQAADPRERLHDPSAGVMVVAHRACHAAAPSRSMTNTLPENSLSALKRCIALGVDMVEIDVRRTQDGALVVMHDAKVDRTTNGKGKIADMTLGEVQALRLKAGDAEFEAPPTLSAFLRVARGRILVNIDLKEGPLAAQAARLVRDTDTTDWVLFKARADLDAAPIADKPLYQDMAFMPIVGQKAASRAEQLGEITTRQASGERAIPAVELDALKKDGFFAVRDAAHAARIRVWSNSLDGKGLKGVADAAGDRRALTDPARAWGGLIAEGVNMVQTDQPAALLDYLNDQGLRDPARVTVADVGSTVPASAVVSSRIH